MNLGMRLSLKLDWRCTLCGQRYEPDELEERRVLVALFGIEGLWCPVCLQMMTPKQHAKACRKLGRIR